jgi:asparagine synthase (glutamine-hydrolysing)
MPREWAEPQLLRMVASIRHESFYKTGIWIDESLGLYLGWAIKENSFADGIPVCNEQGNLVLLFSGEEYPDPGIACRLRDRGHAFKAEGPSYLVHLSEEDSSFPACLNGRFHGLLVDKLGGTATLFNDRYGMHRAYYHESSEAFYFAAEAKAILSVRPELRSLDSRGLGELVSCGSLMENRTLFKNIYILPPASAWVFRGGAIETKGAYFHPREWEDQAPLEPEAYYTELREVFSRNLPRYFSGPQPVGMSLTGGLDTRILMAWRNAAPHTLPCYTYGGMYRECQDVRLARQVAEVCEQSYQVIPAGSDFLARFPYYAERSIYLSDGCTDLTRSPDLYLNEKAREIAPIRMVGTFGSEILRQYAMFKPKEPAAGLFNPELLGFVQQASATYAEARRTHPVSFVAFRQCPWYHAGIFTLDETQISARCPYLDNDFVRTVFRAPQMADSIANDEIRLRLIRDGSAVLGGIRTDRGLGWGLGSVSSAVSQYLLNFSFRAEWAYDYGMPQWLAKIDHSFSALHLERLFLGRHKIFHFRLWYRDALAAYVREILLDPRSLSRPYIERKGLESIVRGHLKGNRNYTTEIHRVLSLELLHRRFLDGDVATEMDLQGSMNSALCSQP